MRNDNQRLRVGIDASALDRGIPGRPFFKMSLSEGKCNGGKLHLSTRTISRMRSRTSVRRSCAAAAGNSIKDVLRGGMSPFRYLRTFCKYFRALVCHGSSTNLRSRALRYSAVNQMFLDRRSFASSNFFSWCWIVDDTTIRRPQKNWLVDSRCWLQSPHVYLCSVLEVCCRTMQMPW